jgi:protein-disulfide isomerase
MTNGNAKSEQGSTLLTLMVLGVLLLQVLLSAGLLVRINQVYQLAMENPTNVLRAGDTFVSNVDPGNGPLLGPATAPVTIVVFSDFSCGACGQVQETLRQVREKYNEEVQIAFRHFPRGGAGYPGYNAALAAICAEEQDAFWAMHDVLFENAPAFDRGSLRVYASRLNLDMEAFEVCLDSAKAAAVVEQDLTGGRSYGVAATPTFFINGRQVVGSVSLATFQREIEAAVEDW